jgi:hypothetical protein
MDMLKPEKIIYKEEYAELIEKIISREEIFFSEILQKTEIIGLGKSETIEERTKTGTYSLFLNNYFINPQFIPLNSAEIKYTMMIPDKILQILNQCHSNLSECIFDKNKIHTLEKSYGLTYSINTIIQPKILTEEAKFKPLYRDEWEIIQKYIK